MLHTIDAITLMTLNLNEHYWYLGNNLMIDALMTFVIELGSVLDSKLDDIA